MQPNERVTGDKFRTQHSFAMELACNWSVHSPTPSPCVRTFVAAQSPRRCNPGGTNKKSCYLLCFTRFESMLDNKVDALGVPTFNVSAVFYML
jgi:hypothetical protein